MSLGYAYLIDFFSLEVMMPPRVAKLSSDVSTIVSDDQQVLIPTKRFSLPTTPMEHLLFAFRYEGVNLQILSALLPKFSKADVQSEIDKKPNGKFVRLLGYLWELFTHETLTVQKSVAPYVDLFDSDRYLTGPKKRNKKWRVNFNGLGSERYCVTVEKTEMIESLIKADILGQAARFLDEVGTNQIDRALQWAYLSETESSFEIEGESPGGGKAERFIRLLKRAHEPITLTETYLCGLQNEVVSNPFNHAFSYRTEQNWLRQAGHGAYSVTYVPPCPDDLDSLMVDFLEVADRLATEIDPLVAASIVSFGFVFLHPFADGNGRLSRFLFHQQLCRSGRLDKGFLLPVSIAMKSQEARYLMALESFSRPSRQLWDVRWIDGDEFTFSFRATDAIYRYWDATEQVACGLQMAYRALNVHLKEEIMYLDRFDKISRAINEVYDLRQNTMCTLINRCLANHGVISKNLRKRYVYEVSDEVFDAIEGLARTVLSEEDNEN